MDQYAISTLYRRFEIALKKLNKRLGLNIKASRCMLVHVEGGTCTFQCMDTGLRLRFDSKTDSILK
jgi:hypothetical protein